MSETQRTISRRTVAAGVAWATPAVAVAAAAPFAAASVTTTTTTLPECVDNIEATGGTYPVLVNLWECSNPEANPNHWDFRLKFNVSASDCPYCKVQIRLWDNPTRSSLIIDPTSHHTGTTNPRDPYYVESGEITPTPAGVPVVLPSTGNVVRRSDDSSTGVSIVADGGYNDALHVLYTAGMVEGGSGVACSRNVVMAKYSIRYLPCGPGAQWGDWLGPYDVDPCIPMISATVCRVDANTDRITVSVARACKLSGNNFNLVQVRRSSDGNTPTSGTQLWNVGATLADGPVNINVTRGGVGNNGNYYWVEFHTGDANIKSRVRIARPSNTSTTCGCGTPTGLAACKVSGTANNDAVHSITWNVSPGATYEVRTNGNATGNGGWSGWSTATSPYPTSAGRRRVEVRGSGCTNVAQIAISNGTAECGTGRVGGSEDGMTERLSSQTDAESVKEPGSESSTTETGTSGSSTTESSTTESSTTDSSTTEPSIAPASEPTDQ